jgi:DNA polymerase-1
MNALYQKMKEAKLKSKMLLQVHDELVFDVHPDEIDIMTALVKETMEECVSLKVPLKVEGKTGQNYFETK